VTSVCRSCKSLNEIHEPAHLLGGELPVHTE
jgi:hypothetical protein